MDPELLPYRGLHADRTLVHPELGACFAGEGHYLVGEMLKAHRLGQLQVRSVLATPAAAESIVDLPAGIRVLLMAKADLQNVVGFPFNRGVIALAAIPAEPAVETLAHIDRLLVLPRLDNAENLGALLRSAVALGMEGVLVGQGPSPFVTRALRVAMGATWRIPLWHRDNPMPLLELWKAQSGEVVGAALDPRSEAAATWCPHPRTALVLGAEDRGLDAPWLSACDRWLRIPMSGAMDSLNVGAAGAMLMAKLTGAL